MRKFFLIGFVLCLILASSFAFADDAGKVDVSADVSVSAAGEGSVFVRMGDWFATVGRAEPEKARIRDNRRARRAEKHAEKAARKAEKEARKAQKKARKAQEKAEKEAHKAETKASGTPWKRGKGKKTGHEKAKNK